MVGKIVGTAAFLSLIAMIWLLVWQAGWTWWAIGSAMGIFLIIGTFAVINPGEWQKRARQ
jgi:hypothetical protein